MPMRKRPVEPEGERPLVHTYRQALEGSRRTRKGAPHLERLSELVSLVELTATLDAGSTREQALDAALQIVMRELRAASGAVFGRGEDGGLALQASRGLPPGAPPTLGVPPRADVCVLGPGDEAHDRHGLELLVPIVRRDRAIAVLGLGPREGGREIGAEARAFLRAVAACIAAPIENGLLYDELRRTHQKLSVKAFELHNLFDVSRDLTGSFRGRGHPGPRDHDRDGALRRLALRPLSLRAAGALARARSADSGASSRARRFPPTEVQAALLDPRPRAVVELPQGPLRRRLSEARLALAVPLVAGERVEGVLAIGERASGMSFSQEDREVAQALARQALGRAGERAPAAGPRGEAAPGPRAADRPRDPAEPLPAATARAVGLRGGRREPSLLRGGRRLLRLDLPGR